MKRIVEFAARFYLPDPFRTSTQMVGGSGPGSIWGWHRTSCILHLDMPQSGYYTVELPPPMFSWSAATWRLVHFEANPNTGTWMSLEVNGNQLFRHQLYVPTRLWQQVRFDPHMSHTMARGPWWLRYRTLNAEDDIIDLVADTLTGKTEEWAQRLRREIAQWQLGNPLPPPPGES